jgi:hypothetical protein
MFADVRWVGFLPPHIWFLKISFSIIEKFNLERFFSADNEADARISEPDKDDDNDEDKDKMELEDIDVAVGQSSASPSVETSETDSVTGDAATSSSDVTKMEEGGAQQVRYGRLCNLKCVASSSQRTPY